MCVCQQKINTWDMSVSRILFVSSIMRYIYQSLSLSKRLQVVNICQLFPDFP